jgi:hypothetical protein
VEETPNPAATAVLVTPSRHGEETEAVAIRPHPSRRRHARRQVVGGGCILVVLAVIIALVGRSDDRPEEASSGAAVAAQPLPARAGPLAPGRYRTAALQPPIDITVDSGWALAEPEAADVLFLKHTAQDQPAAELTVLALKRVFLRDRTYQHGPDYVAAGAGEPAPPNLLDWLQGHPRLRVSKPTQSRIGAVDAVRVDIEARSPYPSDVCVGPCVALFQLDAEPGAYRLVKLDHGKTMRLYIARVDGRTVLVSIVAPTESMEAVAPAVDSVVRTMTIAP